MWPPVYPQAASTEIAPTIRIHHEEIDASKRPATQATANERKAARFTAFAEASPDAVKRIGPTRTSSVPRIPSE